MIIEIKKENGKWVVNSKSIDQLTSTEKLLLNEFFHEAKLAQEQSNKEENEK